MYDPIDIVEYAFHLCVVSEVTRNSLRGRTFKNYLVPRPPSLGTLLQATHPSAKKYPVLIAGLVSTWNRVARRVAIPENHSAYVCRVKY